MKLSKIINNIKKDHPKHHINLIVDEYDAENLDKPEAEALNQIFTKDENFRDVFDNISCLRRNFRTVIPN